jgi:hypothetical protein
VEDGVVVSEEVNLVDAQRVGAYLLDDAFNDLVVAGLDEGRGTTALLTTFTLRRWLPFPPVRGSPTFSLSFWMLAWISSCDSSIVVYQIIINSIFCIKARPTGQLSTPFQDPGAAPIIAGGGLPLHGDVLAGSKL